MVNRRPTYVLAARRELRETISADWQARVSELGGTSAAHSESPHRMQSEADAEELERMREAFGSSLRVEVRGLRHLAD